MLSVMMIVWNEEFLLPKTLKHLNTVDCIDEIVVLDSMSTDTTRRILDDFKTSKKYKWDACEMTSFSEQRNKAKSMTSGNDNDWILCLDADEAVSYKINNLYSSIETMKYNIYKPNLYAMCIDDSHFVPSKSGCMSPRLFRKGKMKWIEVGGYEVPVHMETGKNLLNIPHSDCVCVKHLHNKMLQFSINHYQLFKPDTMLMAKQDRWHTAAGIFNINFLHVTDEEDSKKYTANKLTMEEIKRKGNSTYFWVEEKYRVNSNKFSIDKLDEDDSVNYIN